MATEYSFEDFTKPATKAAPKEYSFEDFTGAPPESSAVGAFTRGAAKGILPAAAGIIGGSAAAVPGALAGPIGAFGAGLVGGAAAAGATSAAQEAFLKAHPDLANTLGLGEEQARADEAQHPYASFIGNLAPNAVALRPTGAIFKSAKGLTEEAAKKLAAEKAAAIGTGAIGAGVSGGMEAGQQAFGEEPMDWTKVGLATAAGALGQKETAIGKKLVAIGQKPFSRIKTEGEELAKGAVKEAATKKAAEAPEFTPEPPGVYKVNVNGKEGILQVAEDGSQTFNGQRIEPMSTKTATPIEPRPATDSSPDKPLSRGVDYTSIEDTNAEIARLNKEYQEKAYEEPEEIMGTPDRPEATPIESTEEFPLSEEQLKEKNEKEQLRKENEEKLKDIQKQIKSTKESKGPNSLWNALRGKLKLSEIKELDPRPAVVGKNPYTPLLAKKGTPGTDLSSLVANGTLDDFLPHEMRAKLADENVLFDESPGMEHIRDKLRNNDYITADAARDIETLGETVQELEKHIDKHLTTDELNELINEAFDEQGRVENSFKEPSTEEPTGIASANKGETPETFALEGYTPEQIKALEAAREAKEAEEAAKDKAQDEADKNTGIQNLSNIGSGISDSLNEAMFQAHKNGTRFAGAEDPILLTAKERGVTFDNAEELKAFANQPDVIARAKEIASEQRVERLINSGMSVEEIKSKFPDLIKEPTKENLSGKKNIFENITRSTEPQEQAPRSPSLKREIAKILRLAKKTNEDPKATVEKINDAIAQEKERNLYKEFPSKVRGADYVREKLYEAKRKGWLSDNAVDLAVWFLNKNPSLANDLAISVRKPGENTPSGFYDSMQRLMRVFKGSGDLTAIHEMMHHMERMMPENVQDAIRGEWTKQFLKESNNPKNSEDRKKYFELLNKYHFDPDGNQGDWEKAINLVRDGKVDESDYQYANSSEFWTVNASKIMQGKYEIQGRPLAQLRQWIKELIQHIKGVIGLRSDAPVLKALNSLLKSDGQFVSKEQLSHKMVTFENVAKSEEAVPSKSGQEAIDIMEGLNRRPPEPDQTHLDKVKEAYKNAIDNPSTTAKATAENAKKFIQHWSDKLQGWTFSADAPLNNAIRRAIMESTELDMPEKAKALMATSMSQTVHADAVSSMFLHDGDIRYDKDLSKWVAEKSEYTFRSLADKLNEMAKSNGLNIQQAEHMFHTATEARRLKDWISENDKIDSKIAESKAKVKELMTKAASELGKNVDLIGDLKPEDLIKSKDLREAMKLQNEIKSMSSDKRMIHSMDPTVEGKPDLDKVKADIAKAEELFKKMPELEEAVKVWNGIRRNAIGKLVETGLWTTEEANRMYDNINYVPFFREEQIENNAGPKEFLNGLQVQAKERRASGSYAPVNDIFDNMVRWTQYAINRSVRNQSSLNLIEAANAFGLAHKIPAPKRGMNVTRVWRDGKQEFWHMEDPMFVDAFHGLEGVSIPTFKAASALANVLRKSIVMNPIFATSQVFQDSFAAIITSGLKPQYALKIPARAVLEYVRTLRGISKTHEELKSYGAVGVKDYSSTATRTDAKIYAGVQPPPGGWGKVKNVLEHISMASDNAVRQAVYQAVMEAKGNNTAARSEAIEKAFEVINFRRRGSSKMMMIGGQLIPFFNAYLAAQNVALKTLSGTGLAPTARAEAYKTLAQTTGSVIALSVLYSMLNANDEDYLKKPATVRDRLLVIPGTGGFSIPLRNDVFTMPKIIAEHMYLLMTNNATEDPRKFRDSMASAIVSSIAPPTAVPQAVKPLVEVGLNYDFFQQKPLIGTFQQGLDVSRQFNDGTSEFSRVLGKTGMIAPINADHLIRGMTGSVGGLFLMLTNPLIHHDATVERPTLSWNDWMASVPGNSAFMSRDNQNGLKKDFYVLKEAVDKSAATFNDIKKRTPSEAQEYLKSPENRMRIGLHSQVDRIGKNLTTIRQNIALISNMPESQISSEEKDKRIRNLQTQEDTILKNLDVKKLRALAQL